MAFLFRMTFTGLCAFVPRQLGEGEKPQGTVLLVNTEQAADDLNFHCRLNPHTPRIWYHGQSQPLKGKLVRISAQGMDPDELRYADFQLPDPLPTIPSPNTDQHRDFRWVASLSELGPGVVADECFGNVPSRRVASRIKLTAGFLSTTRLIKFANGEDTVWHFRKSPEGQVHLLRAIAAEFSLTAMVNANDIKLDIDDQVTGQTTSVTLEPVGSEVAVHVENSCDSKDDQGALEDFAWFYRLLLNRGDILLPYRKPSGGISDTMCPPARFPEHPGA